MNTDVLFSSGKDNWQTPPSLFAQLHNEFRFTLDGAADAGNHLCARWLGPGSTISENALIYDLADGGRVFCNPPYSQVAEFMAWASACCEHALFVMLVPARTDTRWWHAYVWNRVYHEPYDGVEVRFLKGRVKFVDPIGNSTRSNSAPFPSAIIVFRG